MMGMLLIRYVWIRINPESKYLCYAKKKIRFQVQSYDLNTGAMENLPPMKYARSDLTAVEFKGRVYAIGGYNDKNYLPYVEM